MWTELCVCMHLPPIRRLNPDGQPPFTCVSMLGSSVIGAMQCTNTHDFVNFIYTSPGMLFGSAAASPKSNSHSHHGCNKCWGCFLCRFRSRSPEHTMPLSPPSLVLENVDWLKINIFPGTVVSSLQFEKAICSHFTAPFLSSMRTRVRGRPRYRLVPCRGTPCVYPLFLASSRVSSTALLSL